MATAQMALDTHLDNKPKRKAAAISVFLNVEMQRMLLKMTTIAGLENKIRNSKRNVQKRPSVRRGSRIRRPT